MAEMEKYESFCFNKIKIECNSGICVACLEENNLRRMFEVYDHNGKREIYGDLLYSCFNLKFSASIRQDDMLICNRCVERLRDTYSFRLQIESTLTLLYRHKKSAVNSDTFAYDAKNSTNGIISEYHENHNTDANIENMPIITNVTTLCTQEINGVTNKSDELYWCPICYRRFKNISTRFKHMIDIHNISNTQVETPSEEIPDEKSDEKADKKPNKRHRVSEKKDKSKHKRPYKKRKYKNKTANEEIKKNRNTPIPKTTSDEEVLDKNNNESDIADKKNKSGDKKCKKTHKENDKNCVCSKCDFIKVVRRKLAENRRVWDVRKNKI